jgi:two-component sensor histidine kinase
MRIMVGELQHRTRNLIGVVMALADRTAIGAEGLNDFRSSFRDRLGALARVQGLLSRAAPAGGINFDELLASELSAQSAKNGGVLTLDGPKGVALRPISVQALAMALYELTTNALKYGALGQRNGRLNIHWRAETENDAPWIFVDWRERGVDTARVPAGAKGDGSGRRLIEDALPYQFGARTTFVIEPDGIHCTIALPLSGPQTENIPNDQLAAS